MSWAKKTKDSRLELLLHIPNGGYRRPREAVLLKASGVRPGVPDLFLPVPIGRYVGLWIELKAPDGRVSAVQSEFMERLVRMGYAGMVAYGWREAADGIESYLGAAYDVDRKAIEDRIN